MVEIVISASFFEIFVMSKVRLGFADCNRLCTSSKGRFLTYASIGDIIKLKILNLLNAKLIISGNRIYVVKYNVKSNNVVFKKFPLTILKLFLHISIAFKFSSNAKIWNDILKKIIKMSNGTHSKGIIALREIKEIINNKPKNV